MSYLQQIKKENIFIADTWLKRLRGLYFCNKNNVCIIEHCRCIHTLFFTAPIDVAFVLNKKVVKVQKKLKPWRVVYYKNSDMVVEQFSNFHTKFLQVGDYVV